jgi:site-specific DNA recombinase
MSARKTGKGMGGDADYVADIVALMADLRTRDADPAYADAPVLHTYARISRAYGEADDEKPERQMVGILRSFTHRHARLGRVFMDHARSAWKRNGKRPGWTELLETLGAGEGNGVVCGHVDRLMRQPWDLETLIRLRDKGLTVGSLHGEYELDRPDSVFTLRILVAAACKESDDKSRRLKAMAADRRAAGNPRNGAAPFGHRNKGEVDDAQLVRERQAVAWAAAHVADGGSLGAVATEWNGRGLTTRKGVAWNAFNVRACLTLPRHGGYVAHKGTTVRASADADDAILDTVTYRRLMATFEARRGGRQPGEGNHWLSNVLRCDRCGYAMVGATSRAATPYPDGSPKRVYRCSPRGCSNVAVDARAAEAWAIRQIFGILTHPDHARAIAAHRADHAQLNADIAQLEQLVAALMVKASSVHATQRARYDARVDELEAELTPMLTQRDQLNALGMAARQTGDRAAVWRELTEGGPAIQRQLARQALPDGIFVAPVGRGARLRGDAIALRFSLVRGEATARLTAAA